jgi:ubiquitin-activating enzyme E1
MDENLYSRQIAVYGLDAVKNLGNSSVLINGLNGTSLELIKHLILSGIETISILDISEVKLEDLSDTYYLKEEDIGKNKLGCVINSLRSLNPYVKVLENEVINYDLYILVNNSVNNAVEINNEMRLLNKRFIWVNSLGIVGNIFCDFVNYETYDINGEELSLSIIDSIENDVIKTVDKHNLYKGDKFRIYDNEFKIEEVIDSNRIRVKDKLNRYKSGDKLVELRKREFISHNNLEKELVNPTINIEFNNLHKQFLNKELEKYRDFNFIGLSSVLGSYAAQEAIKGLTNKYLPISQWLYYDCLDLVFDSEYVKENDRYDCLRMLLGNNNVNKIKDSSIFVVGAGAIGCEHLKNFSMLGFGRGDKSNIYITDMDIIEKSNLNRQFLFRREHIGELKSKIAVMESKKLNKDINFCSLSEKLCKESEDYFNNNFFNSVDLVASALDNVEARLYVDSRCILFNKPLFESGTLGTKGNTQVIIPNLTEHYGASQDEENRSFPVCTIKNFPNSIEHIIHWSLDEFEEIFNIYPNSINKLKEDINLKNYEGNEKDEIINNVKYFLKNSMLEYKDCVLFALDRFNEKYNFGIKKLLKEYPKDLLTSSGGLFWSGGKVCPVEVNFDKSNKFHYDYVISLSELVAEMCNIDIIEIDLDNIILNYNYNQLNDNFDLSNINVRSIKLEKDNDENNHIRFLNSCVNLRAYNYNIEQISFLETKLKAGKIVPAISTTTSIVSGLLMKEVIKYMIGKDNYKNSYINTSINLLMSSDPLECERNCLGNSVWNYLEIDYDIKISELKEKVLSLYNLELDVIYYKDKLLLSPLNYNTDKNNLMLSELMLKYNEEVVEGRVYELELECYDSEINLPNLKFKM